MTYRQSFNHLGQPRSPRLRRHYRRVLMRWLTVVAVITLWGLLTGWLDGAV
jgi:hypothetical protein